MPPTSIFISAPSAGTSGIGYSRISVLLRPVRAAASTLSATDLFLHCCRPIAERHTTGAVAGLDPAIHLLRRRWAPGSSLAVTCRDLVNASLRKEKPRAHSCARPHAGGGTDAFL